MGGSSSKSSSQPVDMTPGAFQGLQQPLADVLGNLVGQYAPAGTSAIMNGYTGPTTTPATANENSVLSQLMATTANIGKPATAATQPAAGATQAAPTTAQPAIGQPQPGLPGNPFSMAGGQPAAQTQGINPAKDPAVQQLIGNTIAGGSSAGAAANTAATLGAANPNAAASLGDYRQQLGDASQTGAFGGAQNPYLDSYIQSAQRNTQQALEQTLGRTLPGQFAAAGQSTQPGGSSAFDRAAALAYTGGANALGDIATNIGYNAYNSNADREASALTQEQGAINQAGLQTQQLGSTAQQNAMDRALQAPQLQAGLNTAAATNALTGAQQGLVGAQTGTEKAQTGLVNAQTGTQNAQTGLVSAQTGQTGAQTGLTNAQTALTGSQTNAQDVNTLVNNLQAQALPRLIDDLGVERGMDAFNQRVNSLLSTLGIASGVTRPVVSSSSTSSSGGISLK